MPNRNDPVEVKTLRKGSKAAVSAPRPVAVTRMPLMFQQDVGQCGGKVRWLVQRLDSEARFYDDKVEFHRRGRDGKVRTLTLRWAGDLKPCRPEAGTKSPATGRLFVRGKHKRFAVTESIRYADIAPGIDLVFFGRAGALRYEIAVAPGADVKAIAFTIDDARLTVDGKGRLVARTPAGELLQEAPRFIVSPKTSAAAEVAGRYRVDSDRKSFGFDVKRPRGGRSALLIDPELSFAAYLGDSSAGVSLLSGPKLAASTVFCDVVVPGVSYNRLTHHRFDCSDPARPALVAMTVIEGVRAVHDIASADADGCYLLATSINVVFEPPQMTPPPLDPVRGPFALLRVAAAGGVSHCTFLKQPFVSLAVDPDDLSGGVYLLGNMDRWSPAPYGALSGTPPYPQDSALLLKLERDLSALHWGQSVGGSAVNGGASTGVGLQFVVNGYSGQGRCAARGGRVVVTGRTNAADFPHTARFIPATPPPQPPELPVNRGFLAMINGSDGSSIWSAAAPYGEGWQVAIAPDDSCLWLLTHDRAAIGGTLYRISPDGHTPLYQHQFEPRAIGETIAHYHDHRFLAVEGDATGWLMGKTSLSGLASEDALYHDLRGNSDGFIQSRDPAGGAGYFTYLGTVNDWGTGRDEPLSLSSSEGRLYGLLMTQQGGLDSTPAAPSPFRDQIGRVDDLYFFIFDLGRPIQITLEKTCSVPIAAIGDAFTYTITLTNRAPVPLRDFTLRDRVSGQVGMFPGSPWLSLGSQTAEIPGLTLAAGATQSWSLQGMAFASGCATNTVSLLGTDGTVLGSLTIEHAPCIALDGQIELKFISSSSTHIIYEIRNLSDTQSFADLQVRHRCLDATAAGISGYLAFTSAAALPVDETIAMPSVQIDASTQSGSRFGAYTVRIPSLPPRGVVRGIAIPVGPLKTAVYGSELTLLVAAGQPSLQERQDFRVGELSDADLSLRLTAPSAAFLGSSSPRPFVLVIAVDRAATDDPLNALPTLRLNVAFKVPAGTVLPAASLGVSPAPELRFLQQGQETVQMRATAWVNVSGDLWQAAFTIPGANLLPGTSVVAMVDLDEVLPAHQFTTYYIYAEIEGELANPPSRVWQSP